MSEDIATPRQVGLLFLIGAAIVCGLVALANWTQTGTPIPKPPVPTVTRTAGPTPTPLCTDAADSHCWETEDEQGPPWIYREHPRVR